MPKPSERDYDQWFDRHAVQCALCGMTFVPPEVVQCEGCGMVRCKKCDNGECLRCADAEWCGCELCE